MSHQVSTQCPLCQALAADFRVVGDVPYYECAGCDFIFASPDLLMRADRGDVVREYDEEYWKSELESARHRSFGSSLARLAEAIHYCRIPITRIVDVGTGPGYLLDAFSKLLPLRRSMIYGYEKYPPEEAIRSSHENYHVGDLADAGLFFECGTCIEVLEHLTPTMAEGLAAALARVSKPGSLFIFNTGLTDYVRNEDPGYLDPHRRGHITCWSTTSVRFVFAKHGFQVHEIKGKSWAVLLEFEGTDFVPTRPEHRIWTALPDNLAILEDPDFGSTLRILGLESARTY